MRRDGTRALAAVVLLLSLAACDSATAPGEALHEADQMPPATGAATDSATSPATGTTGGGPTGPAAAQEGTTTDVAAPSPYVVSDGRARDARLTIPRLGIDDVLVRSYPGHTDDAAGSAIQDTGATASPSGPEGGTGPGGIGNYQVTGHRTSATRVFDFLPDLRVGDRVLVEAGHTVYVYEVSGTRITSFRSPRSLRGQRAAVPGHPGRQALRAMITLSTCRTQEDHAEGNYWSDELHNPEHRIVKIGVLVRTRSTG